MKILYSVIAALWLLPGAGQAAEPATKPAALFDLSKVEGMNRFTGPEAGKPLLAERGLLISPETEPQIFHFYFAGDLPYFVTTDAALHIYGVILEKGFRALEARQTEQFAKFQAALWKNLCEDFDKETPPFDQPHPSLPEPVRLPAATMAAVASRLLDPDWKPETDKGRRLYDKIDADVEAELKRIAAERPDKSPLFGDKVDYSLFRPRGFHAGEEQLRRYFQARMFWAVPMNLEEGRVLQTAIVLALEREGGGYRDLTQWVDELAGPTVIPSVGKVASVLGFSAKGLKIDELEKLTRTVGLFDACQKLRGGLPAPPMPIGADLRQVIDEAVLRPEERPLRAALWPQAALPDSVILARCFWPKVPKLRNPGGLDVLASCGSDRALDLLLAAESKDNREPLEKIIKDTRAKRWRLTGHIDSADPWFDEPEPDPAERTPDNEEVPRRRSMAEVPDLETIQSARVWAGLDLVFETLREPGLTPAHPKFMSTPAYTDKSLGTALAAWATYRHTFALQGADLGYCLGGAESPRGYVEPNVRFWSTLRDVAIQDYLWLKEKGADEPQLLVLSQFCKRAGDIAAKQLAGRTLSVGDEEWFYQLGIIMCELCGYHTNMPEDVQDESGVVVDIASDRLGQNVQYVGTGRPRAIYVIMDYGGKPRLARGGVMSYREFTQPAAGGRMTDRQWQDQIKAGKEPPAPTWLAALGAGYIAESVLADVKDGRVPAEAIERLANREILSALTDLCATRAEKGLHGAWPPNEPHYVLARLIDHHPELVDKALLDRYLVLALKNIWPTDTLPRQKQWLDLYIKTSGDWAKLDPEIFKGSACLEGLGSVIARIDAPVAREWLNATLDKDRAESLSPLCWDLARRRDELSDAALTMLTDHLLARIDAAMSARLEKETSMKPPVTPPRLAIPVPISEMPPGLSETLRALSQLWPYWTPLEGERNWLLALAPSDKPVVYPAAQATVHDRVVAALKKLATQVKMKDSSESRVVIESMAEILGPESLKTPLADAIRQNPAALRYAAPGETATITKEP